MPFSKDFKSYRDWLSAHPQNTSYNRRIINEHRKFPKASLSQLRGHPGKGRKPITKLKPKKERKKPKLMEIVISGNVTNDNRTMSGSHVYGEYYIKSTRSENAIESDIRKSLKKEGVNLWSLDPSNEDEEPIIVAFRENIPEEHKTISQKKMKSDFIKEINESLQPAGLKNKPGVSHRSVSERKAREQRKLEREKIRNELKRRYDDNEI